MMALDECLVDRRDGHADDDHESATSAAKPAPEPQLIQTPRGRTEAPKSASECPTFRLCQECVAFRIRIWLPPQMMKIMMVEFMYRSSPESPDSQVQMSRTLAVRRSPTRPCVYLFVFEHPFITPRAVTASGTWRPGDFRRK